MELIDKANILADFYNLRDDEVWATFFDEHGDGVLMGYLVFSGYILQLSQEGEEKVFEAYSAILESLEAEDGEYNSLSDIISAPFTEDN